MMSHLTPDIICDYRELVTNAWSKKNSDKLAPNISQFFENFNRTAFYFCQFILSLSQPEERARGLEYLMEIAQHCLTIGNFSTFMQVMSAIEHTSICRLKQSWFYLSKHVSHDLIKPVYNWVDAIITTSFVYRPSTSYKNSRRYLPLIINLRHYEMLLKGRITTKPPHVTFINSQQAHATMYPSPWSSIK